MRGVPVRRLAALLAAALFAATSAAAQTVVVGPGAGAVAAVPGETFTVPVVADMTNAGGASLGSISGRLLWRPGTVKFLGASAGTAGTPTLNPDTTAGVLHFALANPAGASGTPVLLTATFQATGAAGDTMTLRTAVDELSAAGTFANLLPITMATDAPLCIAGGLWGDIDNSGTITSFDALLIVTQAVGIPITPLTVANGDVDGDGKVNTRDALGVLSEVVGLQTPGFRTGQPNGGSCAARRPVAVAINPASLSLVPGDLVALSVAQTDSVGAIVAGPPAAWLSRNPGVATVDSTGAVTAVAVGTTEIVAATAPGVVDSAAVTVSGTRHVWYVAAAAAGNTNQTGSPNLPFASIARGVAAAQAGDTVRVAVGRYDTTVTLDHDVTLLGDTLADGSRPVIAASAEDAGLHLTGSGNRDVAYFTVESGWAAVDVDGPATVALTGLVAHTLTGAVIDQPASTLRLTASVFTGPSSSTCCSGAGIDESYATADSVVVDHSEIDDYYGSAIYAPNGGTFVIRDSKLHDFGSYGLYLGGDGGTVALAVDSSVIASSQYELFYLEDVASAVITHSLLVNQNDDLIEQWQENIENGGAFVLRGDSISASDNAWLNLNGLDSVVVDSVRANLPSAYSDIYQVPVVRVTNSVFNNASDDVLYVSDGNGGVMDVRHVQFVGDPADDLDGYPIDAEGLRTTVDSSSFTNAYEAVYAEGDSSLTVTNSTFQHVEYAIEYDGTWAVGCGVECGPPTSGVVARNNVINGYYYAVEADDGTAAIDSNTFVGAESYEGVYVWNVTAASVTNNTFAGGEDPIEVDAGDTAFTAQITDNVLTGVTSSGIYVSGNASEDTVRPRMNVLRNQITCDPSGTYQGVQVYETDAMVADNQISNCSGALYLRSSTTTARWDSVLGNTITLPTGTYAYGGIVVQQNLHSLVAGNSVVADTAGSADFGSIYADGYSDSAAVTIDSNTVNGGLFYGIYVLHMDSTLISRNTVQGVRNNLGIGAIGVLGYLRVRAAVVGNTVRHAYGSGISVQNYDTATTLIDSNMVSGSGFSGIEIDEGAAQFRRNTLTGNAVGVTLYGNGQASLANDSNNIAGNTYGLVAYQYLSATDNWWGDAKGPRCGTNTEYACDPTSTGDSVSDNEVAWAPALGAPNAAAPPPSAPRYLAALRAPARPSPLRSVPPAVAMTAPRTHAPVRGSRAAATAAVMATPATATSNPVLAQRLRLWATQRATRETRRALMAQQRSTTAAARDARHAAALAARPAHAVRAAAPAAPAAKPGEQRP